MFLICFEACYCLAQAFNRSWHHLDSEKWKWDSENFSFSLWNFPFVFQFCMHWNFQIRLLTTKVCKHLLQSWTIVHYWKIYMMSVFFITGWEYIFICCFLCFFAVQSRFKALWNALMTIKKEFKPGHFTYRCIRQSFWTGFAVVLLVRHFESIQAIVWLWQKVMLDFSMFSILWHSLFTSIWKLLTKPWYHQLICLSWQGQNAIQQQLSSCFGF